MKACSGEETQFYFALQIMEIRHKQTQFEWQGSKLHVSSNFDSGNMQNARLLDGKLIITPALDPMHPQYSLKPSSKTFFHFKLQSSEPVVVRVVVERMKILEYFAEEEQFEEYYRICVGRRNHGRGAVQYEKCKLDGMRKVVGEAGLELHFNIKIEEEIYLAYHYPYPYEKISDYLIQIQEKVTIINQLQQQIYFKNELLVQSLERRAVNLITLTSNNSIQEQEQSRISRSVFPYYQIEGRPKKFNKPYVFFTCRVHSGQTSSSYALEGIINFLISSDPRAKALREIFVFIIVPIMNPDGVFHGTYRMDTSGHNLNRFYNSAQSHKQPAVFAVQTIVSYYSQRIVFFMDLHSHPHPNKGSFIYGNCLGEIEEQTETQMYAKILSMQSQCFGYNWCNFSSSQMNSRDINEILTKDGSARVQIFKILNIPFAYTMELGYHGCPIKKRSQQEVSSSDYKRTQKYFTMDDYRQHGKSIAVSLLYLFQGNTSSGSKFERFKAYPSMRQEVFKDIIERQERFRSADSFVYKKSKFINELAYEKVYHPFFKRFSQLEPSLIKKMVIQKRNLIHTISQNSQAKKIKNYTRKQLSLNMGEISKTLDNHSSNRQKIIPSFRSAYQTHEREQLPRHYLIDGKGDSQSFAKMLNLDFNPFPPSQRKKTFNIIGNRRSAIKSKLVNELEHTARSEAKKENFDIATIDVCSQMQVADRNFKETIKYEIVQTSRNKVMNNFNHNLYIDNQDGNQYNDIRWQGIGGKIQQARLMFPKINNVPQRTLQNFNIQVEFQKQYDKKYNIREHKDLTPHHKASLRNNGLKMRSLAKGNQPK